MNTTRTIFRDSFNILESSAYGRRVNIRVPYSVILPMPPNPVVEGRKHFRTGARQEAS